MTRALLLTCEHASARVPAAHAALFASARAQRVLASHRGSDLGALALARTLRRRTGAPLVAGRITRLLVELNRSPGHAGAQSEFRKRLPPQARDALDARYYRPHHAAVGQAIDGALRRHRSVLHVGVHSFTPVLGGERRRADIGLLYDPQRPREKAFCAAMLAQLVERAPTLRVRRNYPYRGDSDGLTTMLRRQLPASRYVGIELEVNQALLTADAGTRRKVHALVADVLDALCRDGRVY